MTSWRTISVAAALWLAAALAATAGNAPAPKDLDLIDRQLDSSKARQTEISSRIEDLEREQSSLSGRLVGLAQKVQSYEAAITAGEDRLVQLDQQEANIKATLIAKREVLSELLAGLQRLDRNPPPALVVKPGDILSALRSAILLGSVVPELNGEAKALNRSLAQLASLRADTLKEQDAIRAATLKLASARADMEQLLQRKAALLKDAGRSLETERARTRALAEKAKTLQQLLAAIAEENRKIAEAQTLEATVKAAEATRREAIAMRPKMAFADARGKLDFPAQGRLVRRYGDDDGIGGAVKGISVATRKKAEVVAPVDGHIEFAGPFRSYGQLLILNAGGGYHVLLSGMGRISAAAGQDVRAGEPLAQMGETAAQATVTGDGVQNAGPVLYIEFRKNGEAVDSSPWWIGAGQEARG